MRQREAWEIDLDKHLAEEERQTAREEAIQAQASYLLEKGQECYPFKYDNFEEALSEMSQGAKRALCAIAETSSEKPYDNFVSNMVSTALIQYVREYWRGIATWHAEQYITND